MCAMGAKVKAGEGHGIETPKGHKKLRVTVWFCMIKKVQEIQFMSMTVNPRHKEVKIVVTGKYPPGSLYHKSSVIG